MEGVDANRVQVSAAASFEAGEEATGDHERLAQTVDITQDGYIYIWVNNASEATKVWFESLQSESFVRSLKIVLK